MSRSDVRRACAGVALFALVACGPADGVEGPPDASGRAAREFWRLHDAAKEHYVGGRLAEAAEAYVAALRANPDHAASLYALAHVESLLGRHASALARLERMAARDPHATNARLLSAAILTDPAPGAPFDLARADAEISAATRINSEDSEVATAAGRLKWLQNDADAAAARLKTATRSNPKNAQALNLLGWRALLRREDSAAAGLFAAAEKAAAGAPPPAGMTGEGDTAKGGAGAARPRALEARWGRIAAGAADAPSLASAVAASPWRRSRDAPGVLRSGRALAGADVDGDGDVDLVVGNLEGPLRWLRNAGGTFAATPFEGPAGIATTAAGDLNADGSVDLLVAFEAHVARRPALLAGSEGFRFATTHGPGGDRRIAAVLAADVDGDGRAEWIDVGPSDGDVGPVRIFGFEGGETWSPRVVVGLPRAGNATGLAGLRRRGAAGADLVVVFEDGPPLIVRGGPRPTADADALRAAGPARAVAVLDADGDGVDDLAFARPAAAVEAIRRLVLGASPEESPSVRVFRGCGDAFEEVAKAAPACVAGTTWIVAGDFDGDGHADLAAGSGGPEPWRVEPWWFLKGGGDGRFLAAPTSSSGADVILRPAAAWVADFDADGRLDMALAGGGALVGAPGPVRVLLSR